MDLNSVTELAQKINIEMLLYVGLGAFWINSRIKSSSKDLERKIDKLHDDMKDHNTRISRVEGRADSFNTLLRHVEKSGKNRHEKKRH